MHRMIDTSLSFLILLMGDGGRAIINRWVSIATKKRAINLADSFLLGYNYCISILVFYDSVVCCRKWPLMMEWGRDYAISLT